MTFDPHRHHRRSVRLQDWDYAQPGAYVVTVCTQGRINLFGDVADYQMNLNEAGQMVNDAWLNLEERFPLVSLDAYILMPNHLHGIIVLSDPEPPVGATLVVAQKEPTESSPALGRIVGAFKSITTVTYIRGVSDDRWPPFEQKLWQRSFYETIIRNDRHLQALRDYIERNPANWPHDLDHPDRLAVDE